MVVVSSACVSCDPLAPYWAKMRANVRTWAVPCNAGVAGGGGGGGFDLRYAGDGAMGSLFLAEHVVARKEQYCFECRGLLINGTSCYVANALAIQMNARESMLIGRELIRW